MTINRKLHCDNPNCPHETLKKMSDWVRINLPEPEDGFMVSDLDFILQNYKTKKFILLEVKTRGVEVKPWQYNLFKNLDKWISQGVDDDWTYIGFHTLTFENSDFNDGFVYFDGVLNNESDIIKKLSF
jgi:hypothetical protein